MFCFDIKVFIIQSWRKIALESTCLSAKYFSAKTPQCQNVLAPKRISDNMCLCQNASVPKRIGVKEFEGENIDVKKVSDPKRLDDKTS